MSKVPPMPAGLTLTVSMPIDQLNRLLKAITDLHSQLAHNQSAWEDEEDSVKEEHSGLLDNNRWFLDHYSELAK